uniref:Rab-GAP TBC domain-containing protein n=1 Tax=Eptatretus burgeri TaxID=7764 RepID=A0A8C4X1W4_EPTBU
MLIELTLISFTISFRCVGSEALKSAGKIGLSIGVDMLRNNVEDKGQSGDIELHVERPSFGRLDRSEKKVIDEDAEPMSKGKEEEKKRVSEDMTLGEGAASKGVNMDKTAKTVADTFGFDVGGAKEPDRGQFAGDLVEIGIVGPATVGGPAPEITRHREQKWLEMLRNWDYWMSKGQKKQLDSLAVESGVMMAIQRDIQASTLPHGTSPLELLRLLKALFAFRADGGGAWINSDEDGESDVERRDQGKDLATLGGLLLNHMPIEPAFWCLFQLCEHFLPGYYSSDSASLSLDASVLTWFLNRCAPQLTARSSLAPPWKAGVRSLVFSCFPSLFAHSLSHIALPRLWDMFFCEGVRVLFRLAATFLRAGVRGARGNRGIKGTGPGGFDGTEEGVVRAILEQPLSEMDLERAYASQSRRRTSTEPNRSFGSRAPLPSDSPPPHPQLVVLGLRRLTAPRDLRGPRRGTANSGSNKLPHATPPASPTSIASGASFASIASRVSGRFWGGSPTSAGVGGREKVWQRHLWEKKERRAGSGATAGRGPGRRLSAGLVCSTGEPGGLAPGSRGDGVRRKSRETLSGGQGHGSCEPNAIGREEGARTEDDSSSGRRRSRESRESRGSGDSGWKGSDRGSSPSSRAPETHTIGIGRMVSNEMGLEKGGKNRGFEGDMNKK